MSRREEEFFYFFNKGRTGLKATVHLPAEMPSCGDNHGWKPRLYYGGNLGRQFFVDMPDMKPIVGLCFIDPRVSLDKYSRTYRTLRGGLVVERKDHPRCDTTSSVQFTKEEYETLCDIVRRF